MKKPLFSHTQTFRKSMGKWVSLNNNISRVYVHTHIHSFDSLIVIFSPIYCRRVDKTYQIFFLLPITEYYFYGIAFLSSSHCFFFCSHTQTHTYVRPYMRLFIFFFKQGRKMWKRYAEMAYPCLIFSTCLHINRFTHCMHLCVKFL